MDTQEHPLALLPHNEISLPDDLPSNSTLSQAKHADVEIANTMLRACYHGLSQATSISALCKLIDTSMNIVERRRKLLCLQYGSSDKNIEGTLTTPLPD